MSVSKRHVDHDDNLSSESVGRFPAFVFFRRLFHSRLVDFVSILCSVDSVVFLKFFLVPLSVSFLVDSVSGSD